ncbi:MAG: MG2 domain-containing protein [Bacteroidota bacterium]
MDTEEASYDAPGDYYDDYYDDYYYDYYNDGYNYRDRDNPCTSSYYLRNQHIVSRNVLASDLGLIAKGGDDNSLSVAVTDLTTADYMAGVNVRIFNYQNQLIGSGTTDAEGLVSIDLSKKPFLLVASSGRQKGYLRLDDGSALSLSMFDVGGSTSKRGLKGFIYGERGVWRPGDSLYVSFVLEDKNQFLPEDHPVVFDLYTPENQLYLRKVRTQSVNGFYDFRTATAQEAPTGNWLAKVKVGGTSFTKTIKIETVKPNRLKIKLDFGQDILKSTEPANGDLEVKWLHGAIAKNLKADINVTLSKGKTTFDGLEDYSFDDPAKNFGSEEQTVFDGTLNEEGIASVSASFNVTDNAPGMLNASFKIRAFEQGGDFSVDRFTIPYSAYESYAGVKIPEGKGWNNALYSNEPNIIPIATVDENGNPVNRKKVKIEVFEVRWRWWWERSQRDDLARYIRN